jgi:hypothetical protein
MNREPLEERIRRAMATSTMTAPDLLPRRRDRHLHWILVGAAAAGLALLIPILQHEEPQRAATRHSPPAAPDGHFLLPAALLAQGTELPAFQSIMRSDTRGLHEGTWTHGQVRNGSVAARYTYTLEHASLAGAPAWLVISSYKEGQEGWSSLDSLWARPDSMTPLLRVSRTDSIRTERTYRDADILVGTTVNGYTSWKTEPLVDPLAASRGSLYQILKMPEVAIQLQAAQLNEHWTGSVPFPARGMDGKPRTFWLNLSVDGTEEIEVPAGRFNCWRIAIYLGARPERPSTPAYHRPQVNYWVSRDQQWLIRIGFSGAPPEIEAIELLDGRER